MRAELSFRHAFYFVRDVRVADIPVAWLAYFELIACLCNFESQQAISITRFRRRPNKYKTVKLS